MPGLLNTMVDPSMLTSNYPNREALLSQAMSRQPQRAMQPPQPVAAPPQKPMVQPTGSDVGLQSLIQEREQKEAQTKVQAALKEITDTREKSGKKFLTPTQRLGIFTKHGLPSFAAKMINDAITEQQKELEPKYHTVTRSTPEGGKITGLETEEELRARPIEEKPGWKETELRKLQRKETTKKDYTDEQLALLGFTEAATKTTKFEYYDKAGKKKVRLIPEDRLNEFAMQVEQAGGSIDKPEKIEAATLDALSFEQKNKLHTAYNAADPSALQGQGINDMEDFAIANKILPKPQGYTMATELAAEINRDGKLKPEEATMAATQAIKAFGKTDTLKKWREKALEIEKAKTSEQKTSKIEEQKTARTEAKKPKESPAGFPVTMTNDGALWDKTTKRRIMTPQKMTAELGEFKKKNPKYLEYINLLDKYGYIDPKEAKAKKQEYNDLKLQSIFKKRR